MAAPLAAAAPGAAVTGTGGQLVATVETALGSTLMQWESMQSLAKEQESFAKRQEQAMQSFAKEQEQAARGAAQALKNALAGAHG